MRSQRDFRRWFRNAVERYGYWRLICNPVTYTIVTFISKSNRAKNGGRQPNLLLYTVIKTKIRAVFEQVFKIQVNSAYFSSGLIISL